MVSRKGTEIRWKEARRQGDWIPGGRERPGRGAAGAGPEVASAFACKEQSGEGRGSDDTGPLKSLERLGFS